jgi:hypothetical protein
MAATGVAKAIDAKGNERLLARGGDVYSGDKVVTAEGALVQIRLADGGYMSVRPGTEMVFDRFNYNDQDASKSNFLVSLVRGGFRSITGLIGRTNPGAYQIRTATATVGIRGTDHEPMVILDQPGMAALGAPGLYDKVNEGETFIRSKGGMLSLKRGDVGFSPLRAGGAPQMLTKLPDFYKVELKTDARDAKDGAAQEKPEDGKRMAPAGQLLRPTLAARREGLIPTDEKTDPSRTPTGQPLLRAGAMGSINTAIDPKIGDPSVAPTNTLTQPVRTGVLAPSSLQVAPCTTALAPSALQVAPVNSFITPTTLQVAPTALQIQPVAPPIAPTLMQVAPITNFIAPVTAPITAPIAPVNTFTAPTTNYIAPKTFTTTPILMK